MKKIMIGVLLASTLFAQAANAVTVPALTLNETTGNSLGNGPFTLGWNFTVSKAVKVGYLGAFDDQQDGLVQSHDVGIWDSTGNLIVSATVPSGLSGILKNQFRYVRANANLAPGDYRIGAVWLDGADPMVFNGTGIATIPQIRYTGGNYIEGASLTFPSSDGVADGYFGPNFATVPEPASWALMVVGFGMVGAAVRRRPKVVAA